MTGRTHDMAAFTLMTAVVAYYPVPQMTLATALVAFSANMIGGLAPDIDQSSASLYRKVRAGTLLAKIIDPLLGGHRFISHSIVGVFMFGLVAKIILQLLGTFVMVDMTIVWWAFMIGFVSHLIMDFFTHEGEPLLLPIPIHLGFPPFSFLRMKTGGILEKSFVFPVLVFINIYLVYSHYGKFVAFFRGFIK
jgi:inner membrane protein